MSKSDWEVLGGGLVLVFGALLLIGAFALGVDTGKANTFHRFTRGQATVITYTVPGAGECRAVLVDGQRHAETCEGEGE